MSIIFNADDHSYKSLDDSNIDWISVTTLVSHFKKPFDAKAVAEKVSKSKKSKWSGVDPKIIQEIWNNESTRSTTLGTWYHNQRESDLCALASLSVEGTTIPVFKPAEIKEGVKIAPPQKLEPGVYPEHMVYLRSAGICGQSDLVEVVNGKINIIDYKGLALDTPIPTITGFKLMQDICVGDIIYDGNGELTEVEHVSEIHYNPCYKIIFDTNEEIICDHEHRWFITERISKGKYGNDTYKINYVENEYTTEELFTKKNKKNILRIKCVKINSDKKELPIDPYLLGVWLGDGSKDCGAITNMNENVWKEIIKRGYLIGKDVSKGGSGKAQTRTIFSIYPILKKLNLLKNKHIPDVYLRGSYEQRLDLLRGLMDSDGYYNKIRKRCVINTTQKWQAEAAMELVSSLGIKASLLKTYATYKTYKKESYNVTFRMDDVSPFLCRNIDSHISMTNMRKHQKEQYRLIKSIELIDTVPTKCISVKSETHSYLAGRTYIKTHNTNKEIKMESYVNWEGISEKMAHPVNNLDDCNFYHYALQLSIYMYIILKHNPKLRPGNIFIHHIIFEIDKEDQWGYPIAKLDDNGEPIVKEVIPIQVPYLVDEVHAIIHYLQDNKTKIKKK